MNNRFLMYADTYEENVMKNCWRFNLGYWENDICIQSGGLKS